MTIDPALLEATIREMLAAIPAAQSAAPAAPRGDGVFADMEGLYEVTVTKSEQRPELVGLEIGAQG